MSECWNVNGTSFCILTLFPFVILLSNIKPTTWVLDFAPFSCMFFLLLLLSSDILNYFLRAAFKEILITELMVLVLFFNERPGNNCSSALIFIDIYLCFSLLGVASFLVWYISMIMLAFLWLGEEVYDFLTMSNEVKIPEK